MSKHVVTICGQEYELRYTLPIRADVERQSGKSMWDTLWSGELLDQATILWGGMKHANRKLTPAAVIDLLDRHVTETGQTYQPIYVDAMRAVLMARVFGNVNEQEIERILRSLEENEEPGKEAPQAQ